MTQEKAKQIHLLLEPIEYPIRPTRTLISMVLSEESVAKVMEFYNNPLFPPLHLLLTALSCTLHLLLITNIIFLPEPVAIIFFLLGAMSNTMFFPTFASLDILSLLARTFEFWYFGYQVFVMPVSGFVISQRSAQEFFACIFMTTTMFHNIIIDTYPRRIKTPVFSLTCLFYMIGLGIVLTFVPQQHENFKTEISIAGRTIFKFRTQFVGCLIIFCIFSIRVIKSCISLKSTHRLCLLSSPYKYKITTKSLEPISVINCIPENIPRSNNEPQREVVVGVEMNPNSAWEENRHSPQVESKERHPVKKKIGIFQDENLEINISNTLYQTYLKKKWPILARLYRKKAFIICSTLGTFSILMISYVVISGYVLPRSTYPFIVFACMFCSVIQLTIILFDSDWVGVKLLATKFEVQSLVFNLTIIYMTILLLSAEIQIVFVVGFYFITCIWTVTSDLHNNFKRKSWIIFLVAMIGTFSIYMFSFIRMTPLYEQAKYLHITDQTPFDVRDIASPFAFYVTILYFKMFWKALKNKDMTVLLVHNWTIRDVP